MASRRKNLIIICLFFVVLLMAVGYAAFAQLLNIGGDTTISSSWNVRITNIALKSSTSQNPNPVGLGESPANLPGGAKVKSVDWVDDYDNLDNTYDDSPIIYSYSFPDRNNVLVAGSGVTTVEVTVTYDSEVTSQPENSALEKSATLAIVYEQAA